MAIGINWAEVWKPVWKPVWATEFAPTPAPTPAPGLVGGGGDAYRYTGAIRHGKPTRRPTAAPTPQPTRDPLISMLMREDDELVKLVREMYARGDFEAKP